MKINSIAYEISKILGKHKDTIFHHLNRGIKQGLIIKDIRTWPYTYTTKMGINCLGIESTAQ